MIRKLLVTSASVFGLATAAVTAAPALAQDETSAPTMDFGTWGVDLSQLDRNVDPGDDFNAYTNAKWVATNEIPADRQSYGAFDMLREDSIHDVEVLIRDLVASNPAPGTTARRIVDAYNAYVDVEAIDATGLAPAQPFLQEIYSASDLESLTRLFPQAGYPSLVSAGVGVDARNPTDYVVSLGFSGMGLPDRDYYLVDSENNLEIRAAYKDYLTFLLGQAGYQDPRSAAEAVYAFEHQVAEIEWARQMFRIPQLTYNELTPDQLAEMAGDFPIDALLEEGQFSDQTRFLASQLPPTEEEIEALGLTPEQLEMIGGGLPAMMELMTQTPLATLKAYMAKSFLSGNAAVLSSELDEANFEFFGRTIGGQEAQRERWKRGISAVEGALGEQLGALYVERYFPPESKARMDALVANLSRAMSVALDNNEWMTPETIAEARAKLNGFVPMIGYPDEFETYDGLEISADDPLGNRMSASRLGNPGQSGSPRHQGRSQRMGHVAADGECLLFSADQPHRFPRCNPAAAVLQSRGRSSRELRCHRRGNRSRDRPRIRRSGFAVRCHRHAAQLVAGIRSRGFRAVYRAHVRLYRGLLPGRQSRRPGLPARRPVHG